MEVSFHYSIFAEPLQVQAAKQGFRLKDSDKIQKAMKDLLWLRMSNVFTDRTWDTTLQRFQKNIIVPNLELLQKDDVLQESTDPDEYLKREVMSDETM